MEPLSWRDATACGGMCGLTPRRSAPCVRGGVCGLTPRRPAPCVRGGISGACFQWGRCTNCVSCAGKVKERRFLTATVYKRPSVKAIPAIMCSLSTLAVHKLTCSHIHGIATQFVYRLPRVSGLKTSIGRGLGPFSLHEATQPCRLVFPGRLQGRWGPQRWVFQRWGPPRWVPQRWVPQ
jgi:hypothetical protein